MGVGRIAPHRIRARYAKALAAIPLPVRSLTGMDPAALTMLAETTVAGRRLQFGTLTAAPKLWVAFAELDPPVIGYLSGLAADSPQLHVTGLDHLEWTLEADHTKHIQREAAAVWRAAQRNCEG